MWPRGPCGYDGVEALEKAGGPQCNHHHPSRDQRARLWQQLLDTPPHAPSWVITAPPSVALKSRVWGDLSSPFSPPAPPTQVTVDSGFLPLFCLRTQTRHRGPLSPRAPAPPRQSSYSF